MSTNTMKREVQAWGVFRDGALISTSNGLPEQIARTLAINLSKFNPPIEYKAKSIPGKRVREYTEEE
jgi:hypothetical protein